MPIFFFLRWQLNIDLKIIFFLIINIFKFYGVKNCELNCNNSIIWGLDCNNHYSLDFRGNYVHFVIFDGLNKNFREFERVILSNRKFEVCIITPILQFSLILFLIEVLNTIWFLFFHDLEEKWIFQPQKRRQKIVIIIFFFLKKCYYLIS